MLLIHLLNHEATPHAEAENRLDHLSEHLRWTPEFALRIARHTEREGLALREASGTLRLTPLGREVARDSMLR
jgi:Mn-dependent DtxR family transcriptional regulator